jgi:hypothetical protein
VRQAQANGPLTESEDVCGLGPLADAQRGIFNYSPRAYLTVSVASAMALDDAWAINVLLVLLVS